MRATTSRRIHTATESYLTPRAVILAAVDIAKSCHDVLIEPPTPGRRRRFRVINTLEEYQRLAEYLHRLDAPALIGFEATGNYYRTLAYFLHRQGFELRLIPTLALAPPVRRCTIPGTRTTPRTRR